MKMKAHKGGGHDNSERWLLTYADLITLLLGLFVILYAMSKIDAGKYAVIREDTLTDVFLPFPAKRVTYRKITFRDSPKKQ